ncbi:MAG: ornithine carbamoyltransferase [Clostridiales bacterium]|jgi:ornithine carbamoyltransferase|nr:ornithine carbamoyltransferase [Clostridiales bacterium]
MSLKKSLLKLADLTKEEIIKILDLADQFKFEFKNNVEFKPLKDKTLAMIFAKPSTRTRVSFETGIFQLGGHALVLGINDMQLGRGETIEDTAQVLSRMVDGIMIRTFAQQDVEDLDKYGTIPVINGLTDYCHPCQVLADLMTIREFLYELEGKKIAFLGSGNVCNSMIVGSEICGMDMVVSCPEKYKPDVDAKYNYTKNPHEAVENADVIVTDTWTSMGQESERAARIKEFTGYQVNDELMKTAPSHAIVQHCLPAHKGEEITESVFREHADEIYSEAENRLHAQKAVMAILMGEK